MEEKELLTLCQTITSNPLQIIPTPYWTAEIYGFGKYIRHYGYFPSFLPLCIFTDHGPGGEGPFKHELASDAPVQFYHSQRMVDKWKKVSVKPCYVLYSPFVFYRRTKNIKQSPNANGTLVYPAHSTQVIEDKSDLELYIKQILSLPEEFHPLSVNLHYHDINNGQHKIFQKYKIPVYTAGNPNDYRFTERFYSILRNFKYSTSNLPMACLFYSVEMGIPHFIYGNKPVFNNKGDNNVSPGMDFDPINEWEITRKIYDLFYGLHTEITPEQKEIVEIELGIRDGLSRSKMAYVLYTSFIKWAFLSTSGVKFIMSEAKKSIKRRLS